MIKNKVTGLSWLGIAVLWMLSAASYASSIKSVSLAEAGNNSALIFEGRVTASRVLQKPGSRAIHTLITFEILDVLKGDYTEPSLELSFLGGSMGELTMHVTDLKRPEVGERGIYFVENPGRVQVNPLYGWDQGHYLISYQAELGRMAVTTRNGMPIFAVESKTAATAAALSHGVARGINTVASSAASEPMSTLQFKNKVRELLQ